MNFKSLGRYILLINKKPFEAVIPKVDGIINYAVDADLEIKERWYTVNGKKIPEVNILWFVKGMTPEIASSLDTKEQILLLKDYYSGVKTLTAMIEDHSNDMEHARNDYDDAVNNILPDNPDFSASRMASLNLAEKIIKSKLQSDGKELMPDEKITDLLKKLDCKDDEELENIIGTIDTHSKGMVDELPVDLEDTVNALKNSLQLLIKLYYPVKEAKIKMRG